MIGTLRTTPGGCAVARLTPLALPPAHNWRMDGLRTAQPGQIRQLCLVSDEPVNVGDVLLISERSTHTGSGLEANFLVNRRARVPA